MQPLVLVFPAPVRPIDRGDRDVLAQRQTGVDNVLKLKAARRNFSPTNLHVFTSDGKVYAFDLYYTDTLASTYNLTRLDPATTPFGPEIVLAGQPLNSDQLSDCLALVRQQSPEFSIRSHRYGMRLQLQNIAMAGPILFFRFTVYNKSNLDYTPDFLRLYLSDQARAKRTSRQDQELSPVYADTLVTIPGKESRMFIVGLSRVTIPDRKEFRVELYEKNGGRAIALRIRNRQILHAQRTGYPHFSFIQCQPIINLSTVSLTPC
ncbi:conjugative transposon protein TraN [Puia sp. P3]|uniref:conjugative transposon protein TraN n=1 Tax=Puia sp. P3 TaxID=3423952 RepID=UPI003D671FB8